MIAFVAPPAIAEISMDPDPPGQIGALREIGQDQSNVVGFCDDWVRLVRGALAKAAGMNVDIRDNLQCAVSANLPERP